MKTFRWTEFPDRYARSKTESNLTWGDFIERIANAGPFEEKTLAPYIKLAIFGDKKSEKGSLRTNDNIQEIWGVEGDHDLGTMQMLDVKKLLERADLKALLYPTASNTPESPRWRVLLPLSKACLPADRARFLARVNGVLGGVLAAESFTNSQSYYFGQIKGKDYTVLVTFDDQVMGKYVDHLDELDADALFKNGPINGATGEELRIHSDDKMQQALLEIKEGTSLHPNMLILSSQLAEKGFSIANSIGFLQNALQASDAPNDDRKQDRYSDIPRIVNTAFSKYTSSGFCEANPTRYQLLGSAELMRLPTLDWAVKGIFPELGVVAIYGASGSGKSFLALDMAAAVAQGQPWFGHSTKSRPVVYIALEGEGGLKTRLEGWESHKQQGLPASFQLVMQPWEVTRPQDVGDLASVIPQGAMVIIDTFNRSAPGSDENSSKDMGIILNGFKKLQSQIEGLVVIVHHTGKTDGKGPRGHSSLFAALDGAIEVNKTNLRRSWKIAKSKDSEDGKDFAFILQSVPLGFDADGDSRSTCVVVKADLQIDSPKELSAPQMRALDAIRALKTDQGVLDADWRKAFYDSMGGTIEARKVAFSRAKKALLERGMVTERGGLFWVDDLF